MAYRAQERRRAKHKGIKKWKVLESGYLTPVGQVLVFNKKINRFLIVMFRLFCETLSPRNDREATPMIPQHYVA